MSGFETPQFKVVRAAPLHAIQTQGCHGVTVQVQGKIINCVQNHKSTFK